MSEHEQMNELLPVYAAGGLGEDQRRQVAAHLAECAECRADLSLWQGIGAEVRVESQAVKLPPALTSNVLMQARVEKSRRSAWRPARVWQLLKAQAGLVQKELWPASAMVIAVGYIMAINANNIAVLQAMAPLAAAAGVAALFRPEDDAAMELALSTSTSPRQILLARLALVFGYDLVLALLASLGLLAFFPEVSLNRLILGWLAPMTFLSALALALSLAIGFNNAILASYAAWLFQYIPHWAAGTQRNGLPAILSALAEEYSRLWSQPVWLFALSAVAFCAALWLVGPRSLHQPRIQEL